MSFFKIPVVKASDKQLAVNIPAHRIFVIDCSGSMHGTIDDIRDHLKNKIPIVTKKGDFVTIVWFQHERNFGCIQEHVSVDSLQELASMNNALDRYLRAGGGTYFGDAIALANELARKYAEPAQIFFMTDGCENTRNSVTKQEFKKAAGNTILVEYGWYTEQDYIKELAELSNGVHIFSKDFAKITECFGTYLANKVSKSISVKAPKGAVLFGELDGELKIYSALSSSSDQDVFAVDEGLQQALAFQTNGTPDNFDQTLTTNEDYYLALWYALKTRNSDLVWKLLKWSFDVYFVKKFNVCFSKQDYINITEDARNTYLNPSQSYRQGKNSSVIPRDDEYTVVQLLKLLEEDPEARMYPYHPAFTYERISKHQVKDDGIRFVAEKDVGAKFTLVYNSTRANVSLNCKIQGMNVDAAGNTEVASTYKNYAIIKDGVKHVPVLPLSFSASTFAVLQREQLIDANEMFVEDHVYPIALESIPVINRAMIQGKNFNSVDFGTKHVQLLHLKAQRKYLKSILKGLTTTADQEEDGEEARERGEKKESLDNYKTKELIVKIAKCSSLPPVKPPLLMKLSANTKVSLSEKLMLDVHMQLQAITDDSKVAWINTRLASIEQEMRNVVMYLEGIKFIVLAGNMWFADTQASAQAGNEEAVVTIKYLLGAIGGTESFVVSISIAEKIVAL